MTSIRFGELVASMTMSAQEVMEFEKDWTLIQERFQKVMNLLELNGTQQGFNSREHSVLYSYPLLAHILIPLY